MTRDELFRTLRRAVTGSFEVLAELGRGPGGRNAFVAREVQGGALVVLELNLESSDASGTPSYGLYVRRELDASIPALSLQCNQCGASISGWARFCPTCDSDLSGVAHTTGGRRAADLVRTGQLAGLDHYELLGEMPRAEGGGAVYFARERASGRLVTLRLEKVSGAGPEGEYTLGATQSMPALPQHAPAPTPPSQPRIEWRGPEGRPGSPASDRAGVTGPARAPGAAPAAGAVGPWFCPTCGSTYEAGVWFCPRDGTPVKATVASDELLGQTIADRYRVLRKIGSGGMGTVYLAEHVRIGRPCALKIMNPALKGDAEALSRFGREAAHASRINHPNVAAIYDFGEAEDGTVYLAMEYVEGESLAGFIRREGAVAPVRAGEIVRQVLDALGAAHALGIVHRDLKPENIILAATPSSRETVKVIDFGIAKTIRAVESQHLTRSGFVVGTPKYMSPEQITGDALDGRTDIYSAGCILYELLVGASPFSGPSGEVTITRRLSEPPPHPRQQNRLVTRSLDQVVVRALARNRDERYRTAEEFRDALIVAARPGVTDAWAQRRAAAGRALAGVRRYAELGLSGLAAAASSALVGIGRGMASAGKATRAGAAGPVRLAAAAARALGRRVHPVLTWRWAAVAAVLVLLGVTAPGVVRWLGRPRPAHEQIRLPASANGADALARPSVEVPSVAAQTTTAQTNTSEPAPPLRPPAGSRQDGAPAPIGLAAPPPGEQVASPASAGEPVRPGAGRAVPATTRTGGRAETALAGPRPDRAEGVPPAAVPAAVLDSVRAKLRLARLFADREEYADAFAQLQLVRARLDALRATFPSDGAVRALRAEQARALSSTTSQCEALRRVMAARGETPPNCR